MSAALKGKPQPSKRRESRVVDGVEVFKCGRCSAFFPKTGFYRKKRTLLGITWECRACHSKTSVASRDKDRARARDAEYMRRARQRDPLKFRERERLAARRRPRNERTTARQLLNAAVRTGRISKPTECRRCGNVSRLNGHHHDYSKPLDVEWLCNRCHGKEHRAS